MVHCNSCQAMQILQGCTLLLPKSKWNWVPRSRHLTTHPFQKCGLNNGFLRIELPPSQKDGMLKKFNVRAGTKESKNLPDKSTSGSNSMLVATPLERPSAPTVSDVPLVNGDPSRQNTPVAGFGGFRIFRQFQRKILSLLASLPLAIGEMFVIAGICALGTVIEQGESPEYYFQKYPEDHPAWGFLTWRWVLGLSFNHIYTAPYFLGLLLLLAASLMACTTTRQLPMVKVARRWSFMNSGSAILKLDVADSLPRARIQDLGVLLMGAGYEVFVSGPALYGFKGLAGRLAPIGVHGALLLIMAGGVISATGGYHGSVMVPQGLNFIMGEVLAPNGIMSRPTSAFGTEVHVNKFYIDYFPNGEVAQFHSDLSLRDSKGKEVLRKTISVNDPLRFGGLTIYQTDWNISALQVRKDGAGPFNLAMAILQDGEKKLFGTFLPLEDNSSAKPKGISILARDLQSVVLYDQEGKFVGVRRPGSNRPITVDGVNIVVDDVIGSTGLQLKMDPGVPVIYAGFGALMLTTSISYLSHSQVWALQEGTSVIVGGKSNRAKLGFQAELHQLLDSVPEVVGKEHPKNNEFVRPKEDDVAFRSKNELESIWPE